jgi:hypothetical protein
MNGREHYEEAERLLGRIDAPDGGWAEPGQLSRAEVLALAQVHATLAAADAQVLANARGQWEHDRERERGAPPRGARSQARTVTG